MTDGEWSALAVDIAKFLMTFPSKQQLLDFLGQLAGDHPEERGRLFGVGVLFELARQYPPHVLESMARDAERLLQELEPFGDHPEDYFTPLLNAGWIKGETLIDEENPPTLEGLVRLKAMFDRDQARQSAKTEVPAATREAKAIKIAKMMLDSENAPPPGRGRLTRMAELIGPMVEMKPGSVENVIRDLIRDRKAQDPEK